MKFGKLLWKQAGVVFLILAWVGIWGTWIPARSASLTLNALYLAEWSTILPESRFGDMAYLAEVLRASVAIMVSALAVAAGVVRGRPARWSIRLVAALPGLVILPPYPDILALWRSASYGSRFLVAAALFVGVLASAVTDYLPHKLRQALVAILSLSAMGLGVWAFLALRIPFEARYTGTLLPGWGFALFVMGLLASAIVQIVDLVHQDDNDNTGQ
ncbi:MAG: hypothetical protein JXB30_07105 [Anaerolineae bacterium]|nr:hypothetical protein [Anaerolineae bacterium]